MIMACDLRCRVVCSSFRATELFFDLVAGVLGHGCCPWGGRARAGTVSARGPVCPGGPGCGEMPGGRGPGKEAGPAARGAPRAAAGPGPPRGSGAAGYRQPGSARSTDLPAPGCGAGRRSSPGCPSRSGSRAQQASRNACISNYCSGNAPVIGIDGLLALAAVVRGLQEGGGGPGEDGAECAQGLPCPRSQGPAGPGSGVGGAAGGEPGGGGMPDGGTDDADDPGGVRRPGRGRA